MSLHEPRQRAGNSTWELRVTRDPQKQPYLQASAYRLRSVWLLRGWAPGALAAFERRSFLRSRSRPGSLERRRNPPALVLSIGLLRL